MAAFKNTKQRGAMLELLKHSAEPMSAEEIFASLRDEYSTLALSTIYRNLERFAESGLLSKDVFNDGVVRYSLTEEHHGHYLVCTQCSNKIKIDDCPLTCLEQGLERDTGYEIEGHTLTIYGKCPECLRREQHKN
jgi:Fe2+/Zn2+ uptake regulation proteins